MKTGNDFKIAVLDDNEFYNLVFTKRINSYTEMLSRAYKNKCNFEIQSFTNSADCLRDISPETDVVFLDYFLDNKVKAPDLLSDIKKKCRDCKIVVMSNTRNIGNILRMFAEDEVEFVYKDEEDALLKSCMIVEDIVQARVPG
jgi:DNA-binding NtrC family response regulator